MSMRVGASTAGSPMVPGGAPPAPGILVIHEGGGLADHTKDRARRLGELGFVAYAMDLLGASGLPIDEMRRIVQPLRADPAIVRARCAAALAALRRHPRVDTTRLAAIGHCFGGAAGIELARTGAPLAAVVGFHAGILPGSAEDNKAIRGKLLLCHGAADPVVPPPLIHAFTTELSEAGVDWQLHLYGGVGHSFTNKQIAALGLSGFAFDAAAERRSWAAMLNLFAEVFER